MSSLTAEAQAGEGEDMATQARSIASLTISFGLVAIPVKLYSATAVLRANFLQSAARKRRLARQAAVRRRRRRQAGRALGDGQGLRVRQGPIRHVQRRRSSRRSRTRRRMPSTSGSSCRWSPSTRCTSMALITWRPTRAAPSPIPCSRPRCARPDSAPSDAGCRAARSTSS